MKVQCVWGVSLSLLFVTAYKFITSMCSRKIAILVTLVFIKMKKKKEKKT